MAVKGAARRGSTLLRMTLRGIPATKYHSLIQSKDIWMSYYLDEMPVMLFVHTVYTPRPELQ